MSTQGCYLFDLIRLDFNLCIPCYASVVLACFKSETRCLGEFWYLNREKLTKF